MRFIPHSNPQNSELLRKLLFRANFKKFGTATAVVYENYGPPNQVLRIKKYELPSQVKAREIKLQFLASPINPADLNQIQGTYPSRPNFLALHEAGSKETSSHPVAVAGNEGVAKVISVGNQVTSSSGITVGDWVIPSKASFGTWRSHAVVNMLDVVKIPKGLSLVQAATIAVNPCTAYRMLHDFVKLKPGDTVIQNGANSGVGQAAIQLSKALGINSINIIRDRPNFEEVSNHLKNLGATYVFSDSDIRKPKLLEGLKDVSKPLLGLNCVSGQSAVDMAKLLSDNGVLVTYGGMSKKPMTVPVSHFIFKNLTYSGFWMTRWNALHSIEDRISMIEEIVSLIQHKNFKEPSCEMIELPCTEKEGALTKQIVTILEKIEKGYSGKKYILKFSEKV